MTRALAAAALLTACSSYAGLAPSDASAPREASVAADDAPVADDAPDAGRESSTPPCPSGSGITLDARLATLTPIVVNALHPWFNAAPLGAFLDAQSRPVIYGRCRNCIDVTGARAALWRAPSTLLGVETTFGTSGRAFDGTATLHATVWLTGITDPQGRFVVGGFQSAGGETRGVLARFTSRGAVDTTFAAQGRLVLPAEGAGARLVPHGLWIDARGILVVGADAPISEAVPTRALALRVTDEGVVDASFGEGGEARDDELKGCFDVEADGDGYVMACRAASGRAALWRLSAPGRPEGVAGGPARREHSLSPTGFRPGALERDGLGRWIVVGAVTDLDTDVAALPGLVRFLPDGAPDPAYGARGFAQLLGMRRAWRTSQRDTARLHCGDRMLVAVDVDRRPGVAVLRSDGTLDETVGARGVLFLRAPGEGDSAGVYALLATRATEAVSVLATYNIRSFDAARIIP